MEKYISTIDTERFGFKIAKIENFTMPLVTLLKDLKTNNVKMIIGRVKSADTIKLNEMEDNGFRVMDTQLTFKYEIDKFPIKRVSAGKSIVLREHTQIDTDEIVNIAGDAFNNYGHYFADLRLDRLKCAQIYRDWARRSCLDNNLAKKIFVAEIDKKVVGFATFNTVGVSPLLHGVCGLGAVSTAHRGAGIYPAIINYALSWGKEAGLAWEEYSCIASNFSAARSYINSGFKPFDSFITLHCWLD